MIDLYFWTTPNSIKPLILLEEIDLEHIVHPVNISSGEQIGRAITGSRQTKKLPRSSIVRQAWVGRHQRLPEALSLRLGWPIA